MILGISGKARAGKDLLYSFAEKESWIKVSFAGLLKTIVRDAFGLTEDHVNGWLKDTPCKELNELTPREALIDFGNLYRKYSPNYWVNAAMKYCSNPEQNYMITDVRFKNEIETIRNYGGFTIRLERHSSRDSMVSEETKQSISETALDSFAKWDFKLKAEDNKDPEDLQRFWSVVKELINKKI